MTVVAIMGILAMLAIMGVRNHMKDTRTVEAKSMIQVIRAAQEARRSELGIYLDCSTTGANWYPAAPEKDTIHNWQANGHVDFNRWRQLGISQPDGVRFGYVVNAGVPGATMTAPQTASQPPWPVTVDPWYVIQAAGDQNGQGAYMLMLASSVNGELYVENDIE